MAVVHSPKTEESRDSGITPTSRAACLPEPAREANSEHVVIGRAIRGQV